MKRHLLLLCLTCLPIVPAVAQTAAPPLTDAQKQAIAEIRSHAEKRAAPLALGMALTVRQIYENMLAEKPDEKLRAELSKRLQTTASELLTIKGQSIREAVNVLTIEQKHFIKEKMGKRDAPQDLMEVIIKSFNLPDK